MSQTVFITGTNSGFGNLTANTLLQTEPAQRPLRTVVDKLGMGVAVEPYNEAHTGVTQGIYGAFGLAHLLEVKA